MSKGNLAAFLRLKIECPHCRQIRDASVEAIVSDETVRCYGCGKEIFGPESKKWQSFKIELEACLGRLQPCYAELP